MQVIFMMIINQVQVGMNYDIERLPKGIIIIVVISLFIVDKIVKY